MQLSTPSDSCSRLLVCIFSLVVWASACWQGNESHADPAAEHSGLRRVTGPGDDWVEHPTAGFRFRHPGPAFQLRTDIPAAPGEQKFTLFDKKDLIGLMVDVVEIKSTETGVPDDAAALRAFRDEWVGTLTSVSGGRRSGMDLDDTAGGPYPVLRAWGYMDGMPIAMRAMVVKSSMNKRHVVALFSFGLLPEELGSILDSLRPSSGAVAPAPSLDQLRLRYPQLRRMRVPPRSLPPEPLPPPPPPGIELVHYTGPAGKLSAYLHVPKDRKRRHPALLWCHGGFGGINRSQWRFSESARGEVGPLFADSDFVVLSPAWRGEAGSDGEPEIYWGEVDDALASIDYMAKLDFVDPARIYVAGHSSGAEIATFVGQRTTRVRAVFAFGAGLHEGNLEEEGVELTFPFDATNVAAAWFRSPLAGLADTKVPTFWFEGSENASDAVKLAAERVAERAHVPFHAFVLPGRSHWTAVPPMARLVIAKLSALKPGAPIEITQAEVAAALAADPR
jgi:alpha/beta superfamily hydrolase